jgi:hypothetical protein
VGRGVQPEQLNVDGAAASSRRRAGATHATVGAARIGQGLGLGQLMLSSREERWGGRRWAPAWPGQWTIKPGVGSFQAGAVADRAAWWPGVEDPRRWRHETSMVARARTVAQRRGQRSCGGRMWAGRSGA